MESTYTTYFKCITNEGKLLNFGNKCNAVDYSNPNVAIFMHVAPDPYEIDNRMTMAMIPWQNIRMIVSSETSIV